MTVDVAARAGFMTQVKVIRRVRTEAGVRRYKQPIGSIIINDGLLVGLTEVSSNPKTGFSVMKGENGKTYSVGLEGVGNDKRYVAREGDVPRRGRIIRESRSELDVLAEVAKEVQEQAGMDVRTSSPRIGSSGAREGWSENQVQAAGDEIAAWGNSMEEFGHGLQDALYNVSSRLADGYTPHRDLRVARHELEQLRGLAREADNDPEYASVRDANGNYTAENTLDSAIAAVVSEGKLSKRYNAEEEAEYAAGAGERAAERASKPTPIKTSELNQGQWVRKVDKEGNPQSDWFQIYDIGEQGMRAGSSRIVRGKTRDGKKKTYYRQSGHDKWETIGDPAGQPFYEEVKPEKPYAVRKVHNLTKGDRISWDGKDAFVQDYIPDKDDFSTPERRKNPVYKVRVADDEAGKENSRVITIPRGTQFGPPTQEGDAASATPEVAATNGKLPEQYAAAVAFGRGFLAMTDRTTGREMTSIEAGLVDGSVDVDAALTRLQGLLKTKNPKTKRAVQGAIRAVENVRANNDKKKPTPPKPAPAERAVAVAAAKPTVVTPKAPAAPAGVKPAKSEYPGYEKFVGDNGRSFYLEDQEDGTFAVLDDADNELADGTRDEVMAAMAQLGQAKAPKAKPAASASAANDPALNNIRPSASEYAGWDKFLGQNDKPYYVRQEAGSWVAVDADDQDVVPAGTRAAVLAALDKLEAPKTPAARAAAMTKPRVVKAKPAGLKKVKNAFEGWDRYKGDDGKTYDVGYDETDNRWYATGEGGWDEVVADAETRDAVIEKLSAVASPDKPQTAFASNTPQTVPQPDPVLNGAQEINDAIAAFKETFPKGTLQYNSTRRISNELETGAIDAQQAARDLGRLEAITEDMGQRQRIRAMADRLKASNPSPIAGMTPAQIEAARENRTASTVRSVTGQPSTARGRNDAMGEAMRSQPSTLDIVRGSGQTATNPEVEEQLRRERDAANDRLANDYADTQRRMNGDVQSPAAQLIARQINRMEDSPTTRMLVNILGDLNNGSSTPTNAANRVRIMARGRGSVVTRRQLNILADALERGDRDREIADAQSRVVRPEPPKKGYMSAEQAAMVIGQEADDNREVWSPRAYSDAKNVVRAMREAGVNSDGAERVLLARAKEYDVDDMPREATAFRDLANRISSVDTRSQEEIRASAVAKRQSAIQEAQAAANAVNQRAKLTPEGPARQQAPMGTMLRDLDTGAAPVLRNGRPLKLADAKLLNLEGNNGRAKNRLEQPSNINLSNRLGRLTNDDIPAITALQDRATENYLRGMTHAAAWKEAIETAERIKVPEFYMRQEGTRDGRGQFVVSSYGGSLDDNIVIRPKTSDRSGFQARQAAQARMTQENIRARQAATRRVPVTGPVGDTPAPESAPAAPTAAGTGTPAGGTGNIDADVRQIYPSLLEPGTREVFADIGSLRDRLSAMGYDREQQDASLRRLMDEPDVRIEPEPLAHRITPERNQRGIFMGGEYRHIISIGDPQKVADEQMAKPQRAGARALPRYLRDDPAYVKDYERGWRASRNNNGRDGLEKADDREESQAFYDGWSDMAIGAEKWTTTMEKDSEAWAASQRQTVPVTDPAVRLAEIQANVRVAFDQLIDPQGDWVSLRRMRPVLDAQGYTRAEQDEAIRQLTRSNPDVNVIPESNQKLMTPADAEASIRIGGQDKHMITFYAQGDRSSRMPGGAGPQPLDSMHIDQRLSNLSKFLQTGPNYRRGVADNLQRYRDWKRKGDDDFAEAALRTAEVSAGLRDPNDVSDFYQELDARKRGKRIDTPKEMDVQAQALTQESARELARTDPPRFLRLLAHREFRLGRDFRKKENEGHADAYAEVRSYADRLESAIGLGRLQSEMDMIAREVRMRHSGLTYGTHSMITTLINVMEKENR